MPSSPFAQGNIFNWTCAARWSLVYRSKDVVPSQAPVSLYERFVIDVVQLGIGHQFNRRGHQLNMRGFISEGFPKGWRTIPLNHHFWLLTMMAHERCSKKGNGWLFDIGDDKFQINYGDPVNTPSVFQWNVSQGFWMYSKSMVELTLFWELDIYLLKNTPTVLFVVVQVTVFIVSSPCFC